MPVAVVLVLLQLPVLYLTGLSTSPIWLLVPSTTPTLLMQAAFEPLPAWKTTYGLGYSLLWLGLLTWAARRAFDQHIIMMFFATFAANKVEGFALTKIASTVGIITIVAWFIPKPWQYLVGFFPPYWVSKAMWPIAEGGGCGCCIWLCVLCSCWSCCGGSCAASGPWLTASATSFSRC